MEYVSLYKKFFSTNDNGKSDYELLFNSLNSNKLNIFINDYQAFYVLNNEMLNLIDRIYDLNSSIVNLTKSNRNLPPILLNWILVHTFIEEIVMSNEIEGVVSTRKEIKELINYEKKKKYKRFFGLVNKYVEIMKEEDFQSIHDSNELREIYDKILLKDIENDNKNNVPDGTIFRKELVEVQSSGRTIHHGIYPEEKIIEMMNESLNILNDEKINLFIRVSIFHYLFAYIHPFYDGNGRMSRFISSYYLNTKLDSLCALQVSVACKLNKKKYYESFKITNDIRNKADLTTFILTFLEILESGLKELKTNIEDKIDVYMTYNKIIDNRKETSKFENEILKLFIQNYLFDFEGLTISNLLEITDYSKETIKRKIKILVNEGYLSIDNSGKTYYYRLNVDKLM